MATAGASRVIPWALQKTRQNSASALSYRGLGERGIQRLSPAADDGGSRGVLMSAPPTARVALPASGEQLSSHAVQTGAVGSWSGQEELIRPTGYGQDADGVTHELKLNLFQ